MLCIDGIDYNIEGVEMFMPGTPLAIGEKIAVFVKEAI